MASGKFLSIDTAGASQLSLLQNRLKQAEGLVKGAGDKSKGASKHDEDIEKAATQFEGLLVQEMLKEMWATVPKSGLLTGSHEEEVYQDMFQQSLAEQISEKQSIGVKDVIIRDIKATEARHKKGSSGGDHGAS